MHRSQMIRFVATSRRHLPPSVLAPSQLVLDQKSMPPIPQNQRVRSMTTTIGGAVLGTASWAAVLAPLVLVTRSLRRKSINRQLNNTLDGVRQLQDQQKRRPAFFDVARRYARNNGSRVDFMDTLDFEIDVEMLADGLGEDTTPSACSVKILDPHNLRYSIERNTLRKCKVWVAIDAEFDVRSYSATATSSYVWPGTDSDSRNRDGTLPTPVFQNPLITTVLALMRRKLVAAGEAKGEQAEGSRHVEVPEEVVVEIIFQNTVISLEVPTCDMCPRTYWVGNMSEKRPSRFGWIIIPIPGLIDI